MTRKLDKEYIKEQNVRKLPKNGWKLPKPVTVAS